jgi:[acyl-carrier-protein] S-malonyltransferase
LLGLDLPAAQEVAREAEQGQVCTAANDNAPGQVVVSGHRSAIERALEIAKTKGARRAVLLPVSAPFHCPLMAPAAEAMERALADVDLKAPRVPLYANVTAGPVEEPGEIRRLLVEQVTGMVRWRESVDAMFRAGVTHFVEIGGKVLGPMVKRIAPDASTTSVVSMEDIDQLVAET